MQRPAKPDESVVRRAAEGDGYALYTVGKFYWSGGHTRQALRYYQRAAEAGYIEAAADLGHHYARKRRHAAEAERYLRLAADSGDFSAQLALGRILMESGRREEGGRYFRLAVDQGGADGRRAAFELGGYEWSFGDYQQADHHLRAAAVPDAPKYHILEYARFLLERRRAEEAAELLRASHGPDSRRDELLGAAALLRGAGRLEDAAVFNARVVEMDRARPNADIDSFDGDLD